MSDERTTAAILQLAKAVRELQDAVKLIDEKLDPMPPATLLGMSAIRVHLAQCGSSIEKAVDLLERN
ncbi:hypothetical protein [Azospirillum sp.]|uniref:hypothetical protein n=1 Tax=Azospirillum sp. TaxID=34012 RepID=UPI002D735EAF|nr:hypothetical protein [Azospirillum sp.]HYD66301.1 hypothetical protein [Azospirillum sp.]